MLRVGLTGGIATGKSRVRRRLQEAGLATLDLDQVAHEVMAPGGAAYADVVAAFGPGILAPDRSIDRRALGALVFDDAAARARLNALVHPRLREEEERWRGALTGSGDAILVTDAALLVESGVHLRFDRLVVAHCPREEQLRRLRARDGLDLAAAEARLEAQMPGEEKRRFAHYPLDTAGSVGDTDQLVDALVPELKAVARRRWRPTPVSVGQALGSLVEGPPWAAPGVAMPELLAALASQERPEMERLRDVLSPGTSGPWYRAGVREAGPALAACAMVPLVLWSLARRGADPPWLAGAAASVARLLHSAPEAWSGAVLFALALESATRPDGLLEVPARLGEWTAAAVGWGGEAPPAEILEAVRSAGAGQGPRGTLAGALLGMARGVPEAEAPAELRALVPLLPSRDR